MTLELISELHICLRHGKEDIFELTRPQIEKILSALEVVDTDDFQIEGKSINPKDIKRIFVIYLDL